MRKGIRCNVLEVPSECNLEGSTRREVAQLHKACFPALLEELNQAFSMGFIDEGTASLIIVKLDEFRVESSTLTEEGQDDFFYGLNEGMDILRDCGYRDYVDERDQMVAEREAYEAFMDSLHNAHVDEYEWDLTAEAEAAAAEAMTYNERVAFYMYGGVPEWRAKQEVAREDREEAERQAVLDAEAEYDKWLHDNFTEAQLYGPY